MRELVLLIGITTTGWAQDGIVEIQLRPEAIYVEYAGGEIVPMERMFFHIVLYNTSDVPVEVQWVRFDAVNPAGVVFSGQYSGSALRDLFDSSIDRRRIEPTPKETLVLGPDQRKAISDIFLDVPLGFIGEPLMVQVEYEVDGRNAFQAESTALERVGGFLGRLPFEGIWYVVREHGFLDFHKRFLSEAFAYDFLQIGADGKSFRSDGSRNSDYYAYGQEVLAAKDGAVVFVRTDISENVPGQTTNTETPGGNSVVIDHGNGQYGYYAHLRPNSIFVRVGDQVRAGDPIAEAGNSGDSLEPHVHFHVMNHPDPAQADGTPVVFESWKARSYARFPIEQQRGILPRGEFVQP